MPLSRRLVTRTATFFALAATLLATAAGGRAAAGPHWIVFSAHPNGAGAPQIFRIETTGTALHQITTGRLPAVSPSFNHAGTRIAFTRLGSGVFSMNLDGSGMRRLTSNPRDSYPTWSPDDKRIAFVRLYRNQWRAFTMAASGNAQHRLASPPSGRPSWTPDGKALLIPSSGDLIKIDVQTGRVLSRFGVELDIQTGQTATVSRDNRMVAFVNPRRSTGPPDCGEGRCQQFGLYLANVRAPHRLHRIVDDAGAAGWSSDSKRIAFFAKGKLMLRTVSSGAETTLVTDPHLADGDAAPAWQPF